MNVAGQFAQYRPVIEGRLRTGTLPLLLVRDFVSRQWRLNRPRDLLAACSALLTSSPISIAELHRACRYDHRYERVTWTQSELATEIAPSRGIGRRARSRRRSPKKVALMVIRRLQAGRRSGIRRRRPRPEAPPSLRC